MSQGYLTGLAAALVLALLLQVRTWAAARRAATRPIGPHDDIPARLFGFTLSYPGHWRAGYVDRETAAWRPRSRWAMPASLAGSRLMTVTNTTSKDGMPRLMVENVILTYVDSHGDVFRLAVFDATAPPRTRSGGTLSAPYRALEGGLARSLIQCVLAAPVRPSAPVEAPPPRLLWWRQRVPVVFGVVLLLAAVWSGYFLLPLIGAHEADAVVTLYRGHSYQCEVAWRDPVTGRQGGGDVDCGDRREGDTIRVTAMGWPRSGTADDPNTTIVLAALGGGFGVFFVGLLSIEQMMIRRRLRRTKYPV